MFVCCGILDHFLSMNDLRTLQNFKYYGTSELADMICYDDIRYVCNNSVYVLYVV